MNFRAEFTADVVIYDVILISFAGSVLFFITTFLMEPSSDDDTTTNSPPAPRVIYDNGHDNKVFVGDGLPQPQFTQQPQTNGSTNVYYPNGNGSAHTNGHATHRTNGTNDEVQPTYRVIEDSRL